MKTAACIRPIVVSLLALLVIAIVGSNAAIAAVTGTVAGTVTRENGAAVPNATVTLTNTAGAKSSAAVLTTTTSAKGYYAFAGVQPGTYTLSIAAQSFESNSSPVVVQQDFNSTVDFTMEPVRIGGATRIIPNLVRRSDPSTVYVMNARVEQETKSQPNNLYQFPGLVFGQPGITVDPGDYPHIRGGDENQVGFGVDGVQVLEANDNEFETNIVSVGMKSLDLYTGGADASYGDSQSGFINEVTHNGKDFAVDGKDSGGILEYTNGEDHGWNYQGTHDEFGGITSNGKFDYYFATIMFKNNLPGNTQFSSLPSSFDGLGKFNFYIDKSDTFTGFFSEGFEQYNDYQPYDAATTPLQTIHFTKGDESAEDTGTFQQDHQDQHYFFNYATYQHDLSPSSYISYRIYGISEPVEAHEENTSGAWFFENTVQTGQNLDYSNDISSNDTFKAGLLYLPQSATQQTIFGYNVPMAPLSASTNAYFDVNEQIHPVKTEGYVTNTFKFAENKVALTTGLRDSEDTFNLNGAPSYTDHYVDPRLGLNVSTSRSTVIRTSYSVNSQYPGAANMEDLAPELVGNVPNVFGGAPFMNNFVPGGPASYATAEQYQAAMDALYYSPYNKLQTQHTNDFDLGVDQAFNAPGGAYDLSVTGFTRHSYDLVQESLASYAPPPFPNPASYGSSGHGHASGVESKLSLDQRKKYDWNGFISYTNEVSTATDTVLNGYRPYYLGAFYGAPGVSNAQFLSGDNTEYPTGWNQRHTVGIVVNKRITNLVEMSAILDAGSGFPFAANSLTGIDAQHNVLSNAGSLFGDVPVTLQGSQLTPFNPVPGQTGWNYKISLNTSFHLTTATSVFLDVDNIFDKQTVEVEGTTAFSGAPYYIQPTPQYPEGRIYYGPQVIVSPIFVAVGVRTTF